MKTSAPNSERKDTKATWSFKKNGVEIYNFVQNRLKADTDWVPFNYTFPSEGQYEVSVEITDFLTSCPATITQLIDAKCDPPTKPVKPANQDKFVCLGSTTTPTASFNATGCIPNGTNGLDLKWYKVDPSDPAANTTPLATGANYTITPSTGTLAVNVPNFTNGVYSFRAKCHFGTCASDFSDTYKLTIDKAATITANAIDPVTSVPNNTLVTAIENRSVTLSTMGCEYGTVTWYKADNSILRTGNPIALTKSDVGNVIGTAFGFYAKCTTGQTPNTCTSANSNTVSVKFNACPAFINIPLTSYAGCESVTLNVPTGSGDGIYKWYQDNSAYVKGSGTSITIYESGNYRYESCGRFNPWITVNITKLRPRIDSGPIIINGTPNFLKGTDDDLQAGASGTTYAWKNTTTNLTVAGSPISFNPANFSATPPGVGKYELIITKTPCISPILKTEVYPNTCAVAFTAAITCDPLAKITVTTTATGTQEYRLDMGDWQTTNVFADVPYGKHTVSVRVTNGTQICYGVQVFNETDFDACGKLNCDGIVIVAKDNANNETNTIPRGANKTLQTLNLSATSLDGADLSKGVTYFWERRQMNTAGGEFVAFSSTQAAVSIGVPGRYTLKMVRGTTTCTTEIAINAKPCTETPDPTGAIACTTPALTAVADEAANRLTNLAPGDVVRCGDFNITIIEATGNANGWNGKGYVKVPYLNAEVSITLRNAVFNDCYQLTNANATAELPTVYTEYDPNYFSNGLNQDADLVGTISDLITQAQDLIRLGIKTSDDLNKLRAILVQLQSNKSSISTKISQDAQYLTGLNTVIDALDCYIHSQEAKGLRMAADVCPITADAFDNVVKQANVTVPLSPLDCAIAAVIDYGIQYVLVWGYENYINNNPLDFTGNFREINSKVSLLQVGGSCVKGFLGLDSKVFDILVAGAGAVEVTLRELVDNYNNTHTPKIQYDDYSKILDLVKADWVNLGGRFVMAAGITFIAGQASEKYGPTVGLTISNQVRKLFNSKLGQTLVNANNRLTNKVANFTSNQVTKASNYIKAKIGGGTASSLSSFLPTIGYTIGKNWKYSVVNGGKTLTLSANDVTAIVNHIASERVAGSLDNNTLGDLGETAVENAFNAIRGNFNSIALKCGRQCIDFSLVDDLANPTKLIVFEIKTTRTIATSTVSPTWSFKTGYGAIQGETTWLRGVLGEIGETTTNGKILKDAIDGVIDLEKYGIFIDGNGVAKILKLQ